MILFLNGSFGVGKTTVGRILRKRLTGSRLYDPELVGSVLMRLPFNLKGSGTDDFQDIELWRKSVAGGIRFSRFFAWETLIVPMAFYRHDYLDEIVGKVRKFENHLRIFCLTASFENILKRLEKRGEKIESREDNWTIRKAKLCIEAHTGELFGEKINTNERNAAAVADEILTRLGNRA